MFLYSTSAYKIDVIIWNDDVQFFKQHLPCRSEHHHFSIPYKKRTGKKYIEEFHFTIIDFWKSEEKPIVTQAAPQVVVIANIIEFQRWLNQDRKSLTFFIFNIPRCRRGQISFNVLLMWSRGSLTAAIWRSPNERQWVKHISFVICRSRLLLYIFL